MSKSPAQAREDAFVGRTVRLILGPAAVVLIPILLYMAATMATVSGEVGESAIMVAEIHAEMRGVERRIDSLEVSARGCDERIRACETAITSLGARLGPSR